MFKCFSRARSRRGVLGYKWQRSVEWLEQRNLLAISYLDFSDTPQLSLVSDALAPHGASNSLLLTPQVLRHAGGAWHNVPQVVATAFESEFEFRVNAGGASGSDGFALVIQNDSAKPLGGLGGGLGYSLISNSVAIEFDTFENAGDLGNNHVAIHTRGLAPNSADLTSVVTTAVPSFEINDGRVHHARVSYEPGVMSVYLDHATSPTLTATINLAELLNLSEGRAWLGFTAVSGGTAQSQEILNWSFSNSTDTSTALSITDAQLLEGDSDVSDMQFTVSRTGDLDKVSSVHWTTLDGTATTAGKDYLAGSGTLEFSAGESVKTISIPVIGDETEETHEQFVVQLSDAVGGFIGDGLAAGLILNDDLTISFSNATAFEGSKEMAFLGEFAANSSPPLLSGSRTLTFGPDGNLYATRGYREWFISTVKQGHRWERLSLRMNYPRREI